MHVPSFVEVCLILRRNERLQDFRGIMHRRFHGVGCFRRSFFALISLFHIALIFRSHPAYSPSTSLPFYWCGVIRVFVFAGFLSCSPASSNMSCYQHLPNLRSVSSSMFCRNFFRNFLSAVHIYRFLLRFHPFIVNLRFSCPCFHTVGFSLRISRYGNINSRHASSLNLVQFSLLISINF